MSGVRFRRAAWLVGAVNLLAAGAGAFLLFRAPEGATEPARAGDDALADTAATRETSGDDAVARAPEDGDPAAVDDAGPSVRGDDVARAPDAGTTGDLLVAAAHGFVPAVGVVGGDTRDEIVLRESAARRVTVRVLDANGSAVPGASVRATCVSVPGPRRIAGGALRVPGLRGADVRVGVTVAQMEGDTEILAPRTAPDGTRVLQVPVGTIRYDVTLAGAAATVESARDDVVVTLRPPEPDDDRR